MLIETRQLFEIEGERVEFDYQLDLTELEFWGTRPFDRPVHIVGSVCNRAGIVTLSFTVDGERTEICARCLESSRRPAHYAFEHVLVPQVNDDSNDELIAVPEGILDLDELAASDIMLELPSKTLCKEDCKGLCPQCGTNLNVSTCDCQKKQADPRLAVLSQLLK